MYYKISSITPQQVRLDKSSVFQGSVHAFVFENDKGVIRVIGDKDERDVAYIPYTDIDYFEVKRRPSSGSSNATFYEVIMHLKNLSSWYLMEFGRSNDAEQELQRLKGNITLGVPATVYDAHLPSPTVTMSKVGDKTMLRWSNPVTAGKVIKFIAISLVVAAAVIGVFALVRDAKSFFGYLIVILFAVVLVAAFINRIKQLLTDSSSMYGFSFSPKEVEYFEESKDGRTKRKSVIVSRNDWFGLSYSCVTRGEEQEIMMLNKNQAQHYADRKRAGESLAQLKKALAGVEVVQHIRISELHPVQRLSFVNWVAGEINRL